MHFLSHMLDFTIKEGYIPINPEATLGYYVSTTAHSGNKISVMKDCIKTELLCDEMWIFSSRSLSNIPEGVHAEMIVWADQKKEALMILPFFDKVDLLDYSDVLSGKQEMALDDIKKHVSGLDELYVSEIKQRLFNDGIEDLPKVAYIVANFYNFKHIDWAREYCYNNKYCPVSPQNILPYFMYENNYDNYQEEYLLDRLALLEKSEQLIWFTNLQNIDREIEMLDVYSATELYYWYKYKSPDDMNRVCWSKAEVPKYLNDKNWALTSKETMEIKNKMEIENSILLDKLFTYEDQIKNDYNIFKGQLLGEQEREFISTNMNAFIFGLISDQSVKAELAWSLPYRLKKRIGHFDLNKILSNLSIEKLKSIIEEKPALHRYPSNIAKYLYGACDMIINRYDGDISNLWNNNATALEVVSRLEEFKGISHKKAALGSLLLVRDLNVQLMDKENINIAYDIHIRRIFLRAGFVEYDTLGDIISAAKKIYPKFPGRLTSAFWAIGRDICRPADPLCLICPIESCCEKKIYLGVNINA